MSRVVRHGRSPSSVAPGKSSDRQLAAVLFQISVRIAAVKSKAAIGRAKMA
ncbi:MAG: hypothetical protein AAGA21_22925 [Pseudomonadota bacterium]